MVIILDLSSSKWLSSWICHSPIGHHLEFVFYQDDISNRSILLGCMGPFRGLSLSNIPSSAGEATSLANARIDWKETPEAHLFKVEVEDGSILQISGERSKDREEKNDKWHRVERSSGKFLRRFRLSENAKLEQVKAAMEDGVLTVTVPKEEVKKREVKAIHISG